MREERSRPMQAFLNVVGLVGIGAVAAGLVFGEITREFRSPKVLVFLVGGGGLFLVFFLANLGGLVRSLRTRQALYGANTTVMVSIAGLILVLVNFLGFRESTTLDLTRVKIYSLSEQTKKVLKSLEEKVRKENVPPEEQLKIVCLYRPGTTEYEYITQLLRMYEKASSAVAVKILDPDRDIEEIQLLVRKYGQTIVQTPLVVTFMDRDWRVDEEKLFDYEMAGPFQQGRLSAFKGEQGITSSILSAVEGKSTKVYFLKGHGEHDIKVFKPEGFGRIADQIKRLNYTVDEVNLLQTNAVPEDCEILVIAGPQRPFADTEIRLLDGYLKGGGRLLVLLDPIIREGAASGAAKYAAFRTGLEELLAKYGLHAGDDIILDPKHLIPMFSVYGFPVTDFTWQEAVRPLRENGLVVTLDYARSARPGKAEDASLDLQTLMTASSDSYATEDFSMFAAETKEEFWEKAEYKKGKDTGGPISVGASAEAPSRGGKRGVRIVLVGDSDFATNALYLAASGNQNLFENSINWLAERTEIIAMAPKRPERSVITLSPWQRRGLWVLICVLMPVGSAVAGLTVWAFRRR